VELVEQGGAEGKATSLEARFGAMQVPGVERGDGDAHGRHQATTTKPTIKSTETAATMMVWGIFLRRAKVRTAFKLAWRSSEEGIYGLCQLGSNTGAT